MRTIVLSMVLAFGALFVQGQDIATSSVPSVVLNAFQQKYPKASDIEWEMKAELYNVEFDLGFTDHEAWYDHTGKLVKHTWDLNYNELPDVIKQSLKQNFAGYRFDDADKIDENGVFTYKVDIGKGTEERIVLLDNSGKILENRLD